MKQAASMGCPISSSTRVPQDRSVTEDYLDDKFSYEQILWGYE
jgi:hypothetical protein